LPPRWQVLHMSGERDYAYMQGEERDLAAGNRVRLVAYLNDPGDAYAAADAVVARAGASTLAELAVTATPSVLVPYPHAADQHQQHNADEFAEAGAAIVIADDRLDGDALWWTLRDVLDPGRHAAMVAATRALAPRDAAAAIVARIERAIPARVAADAEANGVRP
jgi:UDP-N-acetylglucosamine--N-acetylmuramyl-(pentapeptide) pyrophosphoryl-undecaprenol N-acetylglucosamine transferase